MTAPTLSIPIDILTDAELETIHVRLLHRISTGVHPKHLFDAVNMMRVELDKRNGK